MIRTLAQIQSQLSGEVNAEGNRSDSNNSVSPFTLLRDLIESIDSISVTLAGGASGIKMKKLTGTSAVDGSSMVIAHGLDKSKIIGVHVLVTNNTGNRIPPNFTSVNNHEFEFFVDGDNIRVYSISGNSSGIDGNTVTILITYEE